MASERKIVQIAASAMPSQIGTHDCYAFLYALCDDGTVWNFDDGNNKWLSIPNVPQPEPTDGE